MKKKVVALICAMSILLGLGAGALPVGVSAAGGQLQVGWSRVDINPWVDVNNHNRGLIPLPMQGSANPLSRQCDDKLMDDNGDGVIGEGDGLFATCLAVTDGAGQTILIYSVSVIGAWEQMVEQVRAQVFEKLGIPGENVMIQGTHTHNSLALHYYEPGVDSWENWKGNTGTVRLQDQNGNLTDRTMTYGQMYENITNYFENRLIPQLVKAAEEAVADRAAATMRKGEYTTVNATATVIAKRNGYATGDIRMNGVRHYQAQESASGENYVYGSNFNGGLEATEGTVHSLAPTNSTMYCLSFDFAQKDKMPIALVNWRAHSTQNNRTGSNLALSSDYINPMSRVLEEGNYRSIFIQGAAGNVNPVNQLNSYGSWCNSSKHNIVTDKYGNITTESTLCGNIYGQVLGEVALECLNSSVMQASDSVGSVRVSHVTYVTKRKSYGDNIAYYAGLVEYAWRQAGRSLAYPFNYPQDVTKEMYDNLSVDRQYKSTFLKAKADYDSRSGASGWVSLANYTQETYGVASQYHGNDIWSKHVSDGKTIPDQKVEMYAFMLGEDVAFVTAPGEMFDRYNSTLSWETLQGKSRSEIYSAISAAGNDWDKLLSSAIGGSYGTPFVMGYANGHVGYIPNQLAYEYNQGSQIAAVGAYEAHATSLNQGEGEKMMDIFAQLLTNLVTGADGDLQQQGYCSHCREEVMWKTYSSQYNMGIALTSGHYILVEDVADGKLSLASGAEVCLNMNGKNFLCKNACTVPAGTQLHLSGTGSFRHETSSAVALAVAEGAELYLYDGVNLRVRFDGDSADSFTMQGPYSGRVFITTAAANTASLQDVGNIRGAITGAIFTTNIYSVAIYQNDLLLIDKAKEAILTKKDGTMTNMTAAQAVAAYTSGDTLALVGPVDSSVTISRNITVDLNGQSFAPTVTRGKLTLLDSRTADYEENEQDFGKVPAALADLTRAAEGYVKFTHDDGSVSFHKADTQIQSLSCRPSRAGIYYGATFQGDQYVAQLVDSFGVALSIYASPVSEDGFGAFSQYSSFGGELFEAGNSQEYTSTILVDILHEKYDTQENLENGQTKVRGRSYIKLKSGQILCGTEYQVDLKTVVEYVSATWSSWDADTQKAVLELYERFEAVLSTWDIDAITAAYRASK